MEKEAQKCPKNTNFPNISYSKKWEENHVIKYPKLCGTGAAFANILITFPINKFSFRQQVESTNIRTQINNVKSFLVSDLLSNSKKACYIYRGCSIPLLQKAVSNSIMYNTYATTRNNINISRSKSNQTNNEHKSSNTINMQNCFLACFIAGSIEAVVNTPLERCQAILQDRRYDNKFVSKKGSKSILVQVFKYLKIENSLYKSMENWYRGIFIIIIRNTISSTIYFSLRDYYKNGLYSETNAANIHVNESSNQADLKDQNYYKSLFQIALQENESLRHILFGCLSGALGCTSCYWLNTIRIKRQVDLKNNLSSRQTLIKIIKENKDVKHRGLYYGWRIAVIRGSISWGITNLVYENMNKLTLRLEN